VTKNLVAAGEEGLNDLVEVLVLEGGEEDGIVTLRDRVARVELASDGGRKSHAGRRNTSDQKVWQNSHSQPGTKQVWSSAQRERAYHCPEDAPCRWWQFEHRRGTAPRRAGYRTGHRLDASS
jgi:hypothetical protein